MHLSGTLTDAAAKQHIAHTFEVPPGSTRLDIDFSIDPAQAGDYANMLTLTLFDPAGLRGEGHRGGARHQVTLSPAAATPGYHPGPLPPGTWTLVINTHRILGEAVTYRADITLSNAPVKPAPVPEPRTPAPRGPGWYRGDFHAHTVHSDGGWQPEDLIEAARVNQLDFITLTDHNTVAGLPAFDSLGGDDLLTIGGVELTTFYGHAIALGMHRPVDWRITPGSREMHDIAAEIDTAGAVFIIAHPRNPGDPRCTGCRWVYEDMLPGNAHCVEIWNSLRSGEGGNAEALALWYDWLNAGERIYATSGTDVHRPHPVTDEIAFDVVYADDLTESAILAAVRRGHLYISNGPQLELVGMAGEQRAMMGDSLPRTEVAQVGVRWQGAPDGARLHLIVDGAVAETRPAAASGEHGWSFAPQGARWCTVELRDAQGRLCAVTNPLFYD